MIKSEKLKFYKLSMLSKAREIQRKPSNIGFYLYYYGKELLRKEKNNDVLVVSYPKSGRTWFEFILLEAIKKELGLDGVGLTLREIAGERNIPFIVFSHCDSSWISKLRDENEILTIAPKYLEFRKIIFLYRDPRDVLVSSYYHTKYRLGMSGLTKNMMLDSRIIGPKKLINFINAWHTYVIKNPKQCIKMNYENLRQNTFAEVKKFFQFIQLDVSNGAIHHGIEVCDFTRMQAKEREANSKNPWLQPTNKKDTRTFKSRKGQIGEHKDFFSSDELAGIENIMHETLVEDIKVEYI